MAVLLARKFQRRLIAGSVVVAVLGLNATAAHAAFPGENGKLAFGHAASGTYQIYAIEPDGGPLDQLTSGAANNGVPRWSSDGQRIVFSSDRDGNDEIYAMDANGSDQENLSNDPADDSFGAWSPDGQRIVFESNRDEQGCVSCSLPPNVELYVMGANGTNQTRLTFEDASWEILPAWSPDGSRIAFTKVKLNPPGEDDEFWTTEPDQIYTMNADGTGKTLLGQGTCPDWSPDGSKIAFGEGTSPYGIAIMNANGTDRRTVVPRGSAYPCPAWSPDGERIAFGTWSDSDITIIRPDGTDSTTVATGLPNYLARYVNWQPLLTCDGAQPTIFGTEGNDNLTGTAGDDVILGLGGADTISGGGGDDRLCGGSGNDHVTGGAGSDVLLGGAGDDRLDGGSGPDALSGQLGTDTASYATRASGVGVDIDGAADDGNSADGPAGARDNVKADVENLIGGTSNDTLTGSAANNALDGRDGADVLRGLGGTDTVSYAGRSDAVSVDLDGVADDGNSADGPAGARDNVKADIENLIGGKGADTLSGSAADNAFDGGPGPDTFTGFGGADTVTYASRGVGVSVDIDGAADDGSSSDGPTGARDNVRADIENLVGGSGPDTLIGSGRDNVLTGGFGLDILRGMNGNDVLFANDHLADKEINCDGGTTPGTADIAHIDANISETNVASCETVDYS